MIRICIAIITIYIMSTLSTVHVHLSRYQDNPNIAAVGRGSVATPGLLAGLKMARDKYGSHQVSETRTWSYRYQEL